MDERTIKEILATAQLDEQMRRVKQPKPMSAFDGWGPWIAAVILAAFFAWLVGVGAVQMVQDAVSLMVMP